jgi:hypothetical protein
VTRSLKMLTSGCAEMLSSFGPRRCCIRQEASALPPAQRRAVASARLWNHVENGEDRTYVGLVTAPAPSVEFLDALSAEIE